jgi:hypothetical protein
VWVFSLKFDKGSVLVKIDRWYPSTKTCHCCGYKNDNITKETESWICPQCGIHHGRDENAAINIREEGRHIFQDYYKAHLKEKEETDNRKQARKSARTKKKSA